MNLTGYIFFSSTVPHAGQRDRALDPQLRQNLTPPLRHHTLLDQITRCPPRCANSVHNPAPFQARFDSDIYQARLAAKCFVRSTRAVMGGDRRRRRAAFKTLYSTLDQLRVTLVLTGCDGVEDDLLKGNGAIASDEVQEGSVQPAFG
jgi:hypothetical protein